MISPVRRSSDNSNNFSPGTTRCPVVTLSERTFPARPAATVIVLTSSRPAYEVAPRTSNHAATPIPVANAAAQRTAKRRGEAGRVGRIEGTAASVAGVPFVAALLIVSVGIVSVVSMTHPSTVAGQRIPSVTTLRERQGCRSAPRSSLRSNRLNECGKFGRSSLGTTRMRELTVSTRTEGRVSQTCGPPNDIARWRRQLLPRTRRDVVRLVRRTALDETLRQRESW